MSVTELVIIDGKEYTVSQPTNECWETLEMWMRAEIIAPAKAAGLTGEDLLAVVRDASQQTILSVTGLSWFKTKSGLARLVYRCLKHKHPDITLEQCATFIWPNTQKELLSVINSLAFELSLPKADAAAKKNE